jgi:hypothetical protein
MKPTEGPDEQNDREGNSDQPKQETATHRHLQWNERQSNVLLLRLVPGLRLDDPVKVRRATCTGKAARAASGRAGGTFV